MDTQTLPDAALKSPNLTLQNATTVSRYKLPKRHHPESAIRTLLNAVSTVRHPQSSHTLGTCATGELRDVGGSEDASKDDHALHCTPIPLYLTQKMPRSSFGPRFAWGFPKCTATSLAVYADPCKLLEFEGGLADADAPCDFRDDNDRKACFLTFHIRSNNMAGLLNDACKEGLLTATSTCIRVAFATLEGEERAKAMRVLLQHAPVEEVAQAVYRLRSEGTCTSERQWVAEEDAHEPWAQRAIAEVRRG